VLHQFLQASIERRSFPCAALAWLAAGQPADIAIAGCHTYESERQLLESDLFDLASLTKVIVSTTLAAQLVQARKLSLDDKVVDFLPEFQGGKNAPDASWRTQLSIRHLLAHYGGLPAEFPFYQLPRSKNSTFRSILCQVPLLSAPGTQEVYSDLGVLLLGEILQLCLGSTLDILANQRIFVPLGMRTAGYNPAVQLRHNCVPTELRLDISVPWQGVVHDETARWLGGVAAHAGLFASLNDLCQFAKALLAGKEIFGTEVFAEFLQAANLVPGSKRCLGWECIDDRIIGHTGFTGTAIYCDLTTKKAIILLSNAVHPKRDCKSITFFEQRNKIVQLWRQKA